MNIANNHAHDYTIILYSQTPGSLSSDCNALLVNQFPMSLMFHIIHSASIAWSIQFVMELLGFFQIWYYSWYRGNVSFVKDRMICKPHFLTKWKSRKWWDLLTVSAYR